MGERGLQWSVGYRFIGFEKDTDSFGEGPPRACWVICAPVPICVAVDVQSGATANSSLEVSTQQGGVSMKENRFQQRRKLMKCRHLTTVSTRMNKMRRRTCPKRQE